MADLTLTLSADVPHELIVAIAREVAKILAAGPADAETASPWLTATEAAAYLTWPVGRIYKLSAAGDAVRSVALP